MKIVIVEDESLAVERLRNLIVQHEPEARIVAQFDNVSDATDYFRKMPEVDLLMLDIQLADGKSFEIFDQVQIDVPIIFTTAFDRFALEAFKYFSVDYLLKPIQEEDIEKAFAKLRKITSSDRRPDMKELATLRQYLEHASREYKERFIIKTGNKLQFRLAEDVAYFYADGKNVFLVSKSDNRKFIVDHTLEELEKCLHPRHFFRISRKHIVRIDSISEVKGLISGKHEVKLKQPTEQALTVSRDRAADFKEWLSK